MVKWLNHVAIAAPRMGTGTGGNQHTVDPSSGAVVAGANFTPTAGRLLLVVVEGAVTSTTPSGWTLPSNGSAIANTGLYVWYRTAAGSDTLTTTHNGFNYPVVFDFYEFPAGSAFISSNSAVGVSASGGAGPTLSGLTATADFRAAAVGQNVSGGTGGSTSWSAGTEATDTFVGQSGTDGYNYSLTYVEDQTGATWSAAATVFGAGNVERLVFAVNVAESSSVTVDPATLTLQGQTPTLSGTGNAPITVNPATLTLQGQTPSLSGAGAASVPVPPATLNLQGQTPSFSGSGSTSIAVPPAVLSLQGQTPSFAGGLVITVPPAILTLEGQVPAISAGSPPVPYGFGVEFEITWEGSSL